MAEDESNVNTLDQLQTPQQVELLDKIDELRNQGLGHHGISLPQLIVCGDQSSGKSSLLEGLTRLRFPAKETKCTAFATEVMLRRSTEVNITCSIVPGKSRSPAERRELSKFRRTFTSRDDFPFPSVLNEARELMAPTGSRTNGDFFHDVVRIQYTGPELPSLTIVDLPGIIQNQLEGGNGPEKVLELVTGYMRDERSIILAVVPGSYDPENQKIFTYLKQYDPDRVRTLGIITKPDLVEQGGENEEEMMKLANNEKWPLKHRWHAIKNRSFSTRGQTDAERDDAEKAFFSSGIWSSFAREDTGIAALRIKLSRVLLEHISKELPSLITAVESAARLTRRGLAALGSARDSSSKQRSYLTIHAEAFQSLTRDALRGVYSNRFFALGSEERAPTRLRTEIQNLNLAYVHVMYTMGHTWDISTEHATKSTSILTEVMMSPAIREYGKYFTPPSFIDRSVFLEQHIGDYVRRSRPAGLPSSVNPWVIGEVFRQQAQSWNKITQHHLRRTFQAMKDYIWEALSSLMDPRTCSLLMLKQIQPELDRRWQNVEIKLEELLVPYTEQDPVTYDPSFIAELEEVRQTRYSARSHISDSNGSSRSGSFGHETDATHLRSVPRSLLTESLDSFTNSEILDLMQTYYKRAIAIFTNNIAILAIENCLMKDLPGMFSPSLIIGLDDEKVQSIAAESDGIRDERLALTQKLAALESGTRILQEHMAMMPQIRVTKPIAPAIKPIVEVKEVCSPRPRKASESHRPQKHVADELSSGFDQLVVTPPSSRSNSITRLNQVDSAMGTPYTKPKERKRVARNMWNIPRSPVRVETTDDDF